MVSLATQQSAAGAKGRHASPAASAYPLGDSWVVADLANDRLLTLNATAYLIWQGWQQGHDALAISRVLTETFDVEPQQALADVRQTLSQWQTSQPPKNTTGLLDWRYPTQAQLADEPAEAHPSQDSRFRVQDADFRIHYGTQAIAEVIAPLFAHQAPSRDQGVDYHVEATTAGYRVRQGRRIIYQGGSLDLAAVSLLNETSLAAYRDREPLCVLHAAGIGRAGQCILLPGVAGAGKSTLTAALLDRGLDYLSDDTVPIDGHDPQALALTPPLCVKAGSISVLLQAYPALAEARVYQRADQPVRYLPPPASHSERRYKVKALVFPHFQPGSETRLTELPPELAFARLLEAGIFALRPHDPEHIGELVNWIGGLCSYQLVYGELGDACTQIEGIFPDKDVFATSATPEPQYEETKP